MLSSSHRQRLGRGAALGALAGFGAPAVVTAQLSQVTGPRGPGENTPPLTTSSPAAPTVAPPHAAPPAEPASEPESGISWAALPLFSYSPETQFGFGAFGIVAFREPGSASSTRPSSVSLIALGTTREQLILELMPELWFDDERWHSWTKLEFNVFPDSFWGIGNDAGDHGSEEYYEHSILRLRTRFDARVAERLYVGALVDFMGFDATYSATGVFARTDVPGVEGGRSLGGGPVVAWDTRDSAVSAYEGRLVEVALLGYRPLGLEGQGFEKLTLDVRQFAAFAGRHVVGAHLYAEHAFRDVPYYYLPWFGGQDLMRGYYRGRYRDRVLGVLDLEYRTPLFARFGGVLFAGAAQVQPRLAELNLEELRFTAGAGVRFALVPKERLNLRLDVGFARDSIGVYVGGGEVF